MFFILSKIMKNIFSFKCKYKKNIFLNNSINKGNLEIGPHSNCINLTNKKQNILIGSNVTIHGKIICQGKGRITIGDYTNIRFNSEIGAVNSIKIGKYVIISHDIYIYDNNNHPISPKKRMILSKSKFEDELNSWINSMSKPVVVEDNVWIGFGVTILKGVRIGRGSIIAANSVVTKNIPEFCIAAGNPAKVVKKIQNDLD